MSKQSYIPAFQVPAGAAPSGSLPAGNPAPGAAEDPIEVTFDGVRAIYQHDGFFNVEYKLKLPAGTPACSVRLAVSGSSTPPIANPEMEYVGRHYVVNRLPSLVIPPRPERQGRRGRTGVNLTEYQAKHLLWILMNLRAWGRPVAAYLVVTAMRQDGTSTTKISNPATIDAPLEPIFGVGFRPGTVETTRQLGALLAARNIPYDWSGCLLLNLDLLGINLLFFQCGLDGKKLVDATRTNLRRGVNCITFADAALGTGFDHVSGYTGREVAKCGRGDDGARRRARQADA